MEPTNYEIAQEQWKSFRQEVMFKKRFFVTHPLLNLLAEIAKTMEMFIAPGTVYYRARIIDDKAALNEHNDSEML